MLLLCWQQCVVAMQEMPEPLATMYCTQCVFNVFWPQCIAARFGHNVLRAICFWHNACSDNTTLWPQCIVASSALITQRFGHNVLRAVITTLWPQCIGPITPLATMRVVITTLWPQCIGPITQCIAGPCFSATIMQFLGMEMQLF